MLTISCDTCTHQGTAHCADCVVSFFCERPATSTVVLDLSQARALKRLAAAGLVPGLAHHRAG